MSDPIVGAGSGVTGSGGAEDNGGADEINDAAAKGEAGKDDGAPKLDAQGKPVVVPPPAPSKRAYKFKIDDQEVTEELTEEDVIKHLQKAKGADKRFQEAAEVKARTARLLQQLKADPFKLLQHEQLYGKDARAKVEEWLWNQIQLEKMDPKEREALDMREKLKTYEAQEKQRAEEEQRTKHEELKKHYAQEIDKEISEAIKASGKQVTPYYFKRVAHYMGVALSQGKHVAAKDVVPLVEQDLQRDLQSMFGTASEEQVLQLLGDQNLEKVRRADLARARGQFQKKDEPKPADDGAPSDKKDEKKKLDPRELEKRTSIFEWE